MRTDLIKLYCCRIVCGWKRKRLFISSEWFDFVADVGISEMDDSVLNQCMLCGCMWNIGSELNSYRNSVV